MLRLSGQPHHNPLYARSGTVQYYVDMPDNRDTVYVKLVGNLGRKLADLRRDRELRGMPAGTDEELIRRLIEEAHSDFLEANGYRDMDSSSASAQARISRASSAHVGVGPGAVSAEEKVAAAFGQTPDFVRHWADRRS